MSRPCIDQLGYTTGLRVCSLHGRLLNPFTAGLCVSCPAEVAKYLALKSSNKGQQESWQSLADKLTAQDVRLALKEAQASGDPAAGAALAAANRDGLLLALPGAAQLMDVGDPAAAALEAGGWLRPLKFESAAHRWAMIFVQ